MLNSWLMLVVWPQALSEYLTLEVVGVATSEFLSWVRVEAPVAHSNEDLVYSL